MNTTIGTGMVSLSITISSANSGNYYYTRFVSPPLSVSSISSNTWTYNFSASEGTTFLNFPVNGTNQPVRVNCYVWRPSTSTKIGTILDGNTASTVTEGGQNQNRSQQTTFSGSAVSSMSNGDVVIMEIWFIVDPVIGGFAGTFFYDGTTVTGAGSTVSNHASYLETPQDLTFQGTQQFTRTVNESLTVVDNVARQKRVIRSTSNSLTVADNVTRFKDAGRILNESLTVVGNVARTFYTDKSVSESLTVIADVIGEKVFARAVSESLMVQDTVTRFADLSRSLTESLTVAADVVRLRRVPRAVSESLTIVGNVARVKRFIRTASNSLTVVGNVARTFRSVRTTSNTVIIADNVARMLHANRSVSNTLTVAGSVVRLKRAIRIVNNSLTIDAVVVKISKYYRAVTNEVLSIQNDSEGTLFANREVTNTVTVADSVEGYIPTLTEREVEEEVEVADEVTRLRRVPRALNQTIAIVTSVFTKLCRADDE